MKYAWVAVVVVSLAAGSAFAQSARLDAMGKAGLAATADAISWYLNPATLSEFAGKGTNHQALATFGEDRWTSGSEHWWGLDVSGSFSKKWGWGAGYEDYSDGQVYGAGIGFSFHNSPVSVGVNFLHDEWDGYLPTSSLMDDSATWINLGFLWKIKDQLRLAAKVNDLSKEFGEISFDAGLWWPFHDNAALAVDLLNVTQANHGDLEFNAGVEWKLADQWTGRVGAVDNGEGHDLTFGVGYKRGDWTIDGAWMDNEANNSWIFSVGKAL